MSKNNISYVVGEQYAILSITRKDAEKHGIGDAQRVTIETRRDGILIKRLES